MPDCDTNSFQPFPKSPKFQDLTGQTFDRLTVLGFDGLKGVPPRSYWICLCLCGERVSVAAAALKSGHTRSCGCIRIDFPHRRTHGMSKTSIYRRWANMIQRCSDPNIKSFKSYGGRGIQVCDRWLEFENFIADMGKPPTPKHSLERKDVNGNYEPDNCKWATHREQSNNKRDSIWCTRNGVSKPVIEWCRELHVPYKRVITRIENGWGAEEALSVPKMSLKERQVLATIARKRNKHY
jgi:hypothetical protein